MFDNSLKYKIKDKKSPFRFNSACRVKALLVRLVGAVVLCLLSMSEPPREAEATSASSGTARRRRAQRHRATARHARWIVGLLQAEAHHSATAVGACPGCTALLSRITALEKAANKQHFPHEQPGSHHTFATKAELEALQRHWPLAGAVQPVKEEEDEAKQEATHVVAEGTALTTPVPTAILQESGEPKSEDQGDDEHGQPGVHDRLPTTDQPPHRARGTPYRHDSRNEEGNDTVAVAATGMSVRVPHKIAGGQVIDAIKKLSSEDASRAQELLDQLRAAPLPAAAASSAPATRGSSMWGARSWSTSWASSGWRDGG